MLGRQQDQGLEGSVRRAAHAFNNFSLDFEFTLFCSLGTVIAILATTLEAIVTVFG